MLGSGACPAPVAQSASISVFSQKQRGAGWRQLREPASDATARSLEGNESTRRVRRSRGPVCTCVVLGSGRAGHSTCRRFSVDSCLRSGCPEWPARPIKGLKLTQCRHLRGGWTLSLGSGRNRAAKLVSSAPTVPPEPLPAESCSVGRCQPDCWIPKPVGLAPVTLLLANTFFSGCSPDHSFL